MRGGDRGAGGRIWASGHSAHLIHKMGALGISKGDARGPNDHSVGFNLCLPTSGQVGNTQPHVRDPRARGESQSWPERPQQRGPGLLKLSRVWPLPSQNQDSPQPEPQDWFCWWLFFVFFFATLCGMPDLSSLKGMEPMPTAVEAQSPNHWTARQVPKTALNTRPPLQLKDGREVCSQAEPTTGNQKRNPTCHPMRPQL